MIGMINNQYLTKLFLFFLYLIPSFSILFISYDYTNDQEFIFDQLSYLLEFDNFNYHIQGSYIWNEKYGIPVSRYILDFLAIRILQFIDVLFPSYLKYPIYLCILSTIGMVSVSLLVKKFYPTISNISLIFLGYFYITYASLISEYTNYVVFTSIMIMPLMLYFVFILYDRHLYFKHSFKFIIYCIFIIFLLANYIYYDPRGFITFLIFYFLLLFSYFYPRDKKIHNLYLPVIYSIIILISCVALYYHTQYSHQIRFETSHLSIQTPNSIILNSSNLLKAILQPSPLISLNQFSSILIVIFIGALLGFLLLLNDKKYKPLVIFLMAIWFCYTILTFVPLLTLLVSKIPYGQLFRTWRVAQYFAAILLLLLLSRLFIGNKLSKFVGLFIVGLSVIFAHYKFYEITVVVNKNKLNDYVQANEFIEKNINGEAKILWVPEMGWFGANSSPIWLNNRVSGQGFPEYFSQKPTYLHNVNSMTHYYTWLASGLWKSQLQTHANSAALLSMLGVQYVIIHKDVPDYMKAALKMDKHLRRDSQLKKVFNSKLISIYENTQYKDRIWAVDKKNAFYCDYGLKCIEKFYANKKMTPYNTVAYITDNDGIPHTKIDQIYSTTANITKFYNLIINQAITDNEGKVIFASDNLASLKYTECLTDTHHGVYHTRFKPNEKHDYANTFGVQNCVFALNSFQNRIELPVYLDKGKYVVLIRHLNQNSSGAVKVVTPYFKTNISSAYTKEALYKYKVSFANVTKANNFKLKLTNNYGNNVISLIAFIPKKEFNKYQKHFQNFHTINNSVKNVSNKTKIINIQKISPIHWNVKVRAIKQPFILNFAETYNKNWTASISSPKGKVLEINAVKGYGAINSFIIDKKGEFSIKIYYKPQDKFYKLFFIGMFVCLVGILVIILIYNVYDKKFAISK